MRVLKSPRISISKESGNHGHYGMADIDVSYASSITQQLSGVNASQYALLSRTTFWVFNLTADYTFVHFNVVVWRKLQVSWCYCYKYIILSPLFDFNILQGSVATYVRYGGKHNKGFLLQIPCWMQRWKNFENRPTFGKVINKECGCFCTHSVHTQPSYLH